MIPTADSFAARISDPRWSMHVHFVEYTHESPFLIMRGRPQDVLNYIDLIWSVA